MFGINNEKDIIKETAKIIVTDRVIHLLILRPAEPRKSAPGVVWIHGGGYFMGMKEMVHISRALDMVRRHGATVVSPGYTLATQKPYPAAVEDCYGALLYLKKHCEELGVRSDQLMVGGESAGGGLAAAVCMLARDRGEVNIAFQMPIYPMIDNFDTETSSDNHSMIWNTRKNHFGWTMYLRNNRDKTVSPYAAAARQTDYSGLPPAYTFVCTAEPFFSETVSYIENLKSAGIEAEIDVYSGLFHAFDIIRPDLDESKTAVIRFNERFDYAVKHYFAKQQI